MASNITWDINWKLDLELVLSYVISARNPESVPYIPIMASLFKSHPKP